jgi:divalent metal cation (Fe/Co/Zn/Cd) transporter
MQMAFVVGFVMWFVGIGLIWFAVQTIKNPPPGFPIYVQRTWQTILILLGVVLIVGVFF